MNYGICNLSIIALRVEANDRSEMVSQLLFGDHFKILEKSKQWLKIKLAFDDYEGWIDSKQCLKINKKDYEKLTEEPIIVSNELIDFIEDEDQKLFTIVLGSRLPYYSDKIFKLKRKNK